MNTMGDFLYRILSLIISGAGAWVWMRILKKADPGWKTKNHKWGVYILAGVGSVYVAYVYYFLGYLIYGSFSTPYAAADDFWYAVLINGPAEEWGKFTVFWILAAGFHRVKESRDGVLVAMMVALGFSFWENIQYIFIYGLSSVPTRVLWASSGHMAYAAIWGYFGGQMILEPSSGGPLGRYRYLLAAVFVTAFIHGLFNFLVSWVSPQAGFVIDLLVYVATLLILMEVCRIPSGYKQFAVKDARKAIPALRESLKLDPSNPVLKRRLGFYELALGRESESYRIWIGIPPKRRDSYLNAWIAVLSARAGLNRQNGGFKQHIASLATKDLAALKRRLSFYLKDEAGEWIRQVDEVLERRRIQDAESIWR